MQYKQMKKLYCKDIWVAVQGFFSTERQVHGLKKLVPGKNRCNAT